MIVAKCTPPILLFLMIKTISCQTFEELKSLKIAVLTNYTRSLRPIKNQNQTMEVSLGANLGHVTDFDAVNGILTTLVLLSASWNDISLTWDPTKYGGASYIYLSVKEVWIPNVILLNGAEDFNFMDIDVENFNVLVNPDGNVSMLFAGYMKSLCIPNVKYFPFDENECPIMLGLFGYYTEDHARLIHVDARFFSSIYVNPQWDVEEGHFHEKRKSQMQYLEKVIKLKRRPTFLIVNLFIPMAFLIAMNFFISVLPVDSGEKASYSMTILLSFTVFVTAIVNELPQVSTELPVLSYIILLQLFINMFVCVSALFIIRYYYQPAVVPVGSVYKLLVKIMNCCSRNAVENKIDIYSDELTDYVEGKQTSTSDSLETKESGKTKVHTITWQDVSDTMEKISFFVLVLLTIAEIVLFLYIAV